MRRPTTTALLLLLISLLMVSIAAIIFLGQRRQQVEVALEDSQRESSRLAAELASNSTRQVIAAENMATREAQNQALAEGLQHSQQELATLDEELSGSELRLEEAMSARATADAELALRTQELAGLKAQLPRITFLVPAADASLALGEPVLVAVAASDIQGVAAVNVTAAGETVASVTPDDETLATVQVMWEPAEEGTLLLTASAISVRGTSSQVVTRTVIVTRGTIDPLADAREEIEANVVELRGLEPLDEVQPSLLTREQLQVRVRDEFLEELTPEAARDTVLALHAFDFVAVDFELIPFYNTLYSEQVAGFYDPELDEFVVVSDDDTLSPAETLAHAHEYVHALQDQHYGLDQLTAVALNGDASLALRALAEGDASLAELQYVLAGYMSLAELTGLTQELEETANAGLGDGPPALLNGFIFPYEAGLRFAQTLHEAGGFEAIDAAWDVPPVSTEQILHPQRYLEGDAPQLVALAPLTETLGAGWRQVDSDVLGEFFLREYLQQQLDAGVVDQAATGWGGDQYVVHWHEGNEELVLALTLAWDTAADGQEFDAAFAEYSGGLLNTQATDYEGGQCWLAADVRCLFAAEASSLVLRAPSLAMIDTLLALLR